MVANWFRLKLLDELNSGRITVTTAWNHLPNAEHIDRILADLFDNTVNWSKACYLTTPWNADFSAARDEAYDVGRAAVGDAVLNAAWDASFNEALGAIRYEVRELAYSAIMALVAWPESADYLNLPVNQVRVLAELGDRRARLMSHIVWIYKNSKEVV